MNKVVLRDRTWLNPKSSCHSGSMQSETLLTTWSFREGKDSFHVESFLAIRDCARHVNLSFDFSTQKEYKAAMRKADLLYNKISELRASLIEAHTLMEEAKQ